MTGSIRDLIWDAADSPRHARTLRPAAIYALLGMVVLILGANWPIMATGVESITPLWMGVFRLGGATLVVLTIASIGGRLRFPPRSDLPIVASLALFRLVSVSFLVFTALRLVPAGRSSVVAWTTPLWTVPIAAVFLGDRMTWRRWLGLGLGVLGVVVLFEPWGLDWSAPGVALGHTLLIIASVVNASTSVHIRRHRWSVTPLDALPWQLSAATVVMLVLALAVDGPVAVDWTPSLVAVVAYQGLLASGIALWAQIVILRNIDPVSANLTMMGVPAVGVISSSLFLGEVVTVELTLGLVLIVIGVATNLLGERSPPGLRDAPSQLG
ncbi:MAG TPA: DMT family transporter [Acidimicrobiia bacterium]|nr:DMT family transporter [Acidimicrobiia bacterium]